MDIWDEERMPFVYVAGPYLHKDKQLMKKRADTVSLYAANLINKKYLVFSPLSYGEVISKAVLDPTEWYRQDLNVLRFCDRLDVMLMDGWQKSKGVKYEVETAQKLYMEIRFIDPATYEEVKDVKLEWNMEDYHVGS